MDAISKTTAILAATLEIQQLKSHYAACADAKYGPGHTRAEPAALAAAARAQADCFTEDACWEGGDRFGGDIVGRAALAAFFADPPWDFATHFYVAPSIRVDGDRAEACWRLWQLGIPAGGDAPVILAARTEESYRRTAEGWRHRSVRFTRIDRVAGDAALRLERIL